MLKLEGFSHVAIIKFGGNYPYHFAIFDDGTNYKVGDMVILSGKSSPARIDEIIDLDEHNKRTNNRSITSEVIGRVDTSAYDKRVERRKQKDKLKRNLEKRKKEILEKLDNEYYASRDDVYRAMLEEYKSL